MGIKRQIRLFLFKTAYLLNFLFSKMVSFAYFIKSSLYWVQADVPFFKTRREIYQYLIKVENLKEAKLSYLEFGVSNGWGFHTWYRENKNPDSRFIGFDTFEGIPEDWGSEAKGSYSAGGKAPQIDEGETRTEFVIGLFQDTLDDFMEGFDRGDSRMLILLDADLYNSTLFVLLRIGPILKKGDILIFDEFFSVTKADTEFRAFLDYLQLHNLSYKNLAKGQNEFVIVIE